MKKPRETKRSSDEAVKVKTGKTWAEWFKILDKAGAKKWPHKEISAFLRDKQKVSPWWSQMVSVGYERERGIRQKFQKCDGVQRLRQPHYDSSDCEGLCGLDR